MYFQRNRERLFGLLQKNCVFSSEQWKIDLKTYWVWGFPGGAVVKKPPASAGDTGSSPGPGRSHMPQSNETRVPQLLSLRSRAREPQLLSTCATTTEARVPRARALQQGTPLQREARAPQ